MREILISETTLPLETGTSLTCHYMVLVKEIGQPLSCESYGIKIRIPDNGEEAQLSDLTLSGDKILSLAGLLCRNGVTPCTLHEVVSEWL